MKPSFASCPSENWRHFARTNYKSGDADLLRRVQDAGYASGTTNRVLVLLWHILTSQPSGTCRGATKNPTTGLKIAPDVCHEGFLTPEETRRLLAVLDADEN